MVSHDTVPALHPWSEAETAPQFPRSVIPSTSRTLIERLRYPLRRFAHGEVARWIEEGLIEADNVAIDDLTDRVCREALETAEPVPAATGVFPWLRNRIRRQAMTMRANGVQAHAHQPGRSEMAPSGDPSQAAIAIAHFLDPVAPREAMISLRQIDMALERCLACLSERWREILLLSAIDGWSDPDIAEAEGIDPGRIRPILNASRALLRSCLSLDERPIGGERGH